MPPPSALRNTRALAIRSAKPTSIDPTGAPRPFDRQNITVSNPRVSVFTSTPSATAALKMRAPSRCSGNLWAFAPLQISSKTSTRVHTPPARFAVFSISISPVAARKPPYGLIAGSMCFHVRMPPSAGTARIRQPEKTAVVAIS